MNLKNYPLIIKNQKSTLLLMYNKIITNDTMLLLNPIVIYSLHLIFYNNYYNSKDVDWKVHQDGSIVIVIGDNKQIYFMYYQSIHIVYVIFT